MVKRFDFNCDTIDSAKNYILNRAIQLLKFNVFFKEFIIKEQAVIAIFEYMGLKYQSIYILKQFRNQGFYKKIQSEIGLSVLTSIECELDTYLYNSEIEFISFNIDNTNEYKIIQDYYSNKKTNRSQVYFMNHIDEGLAILEWINASTYAKRAYCLHPILQSDEDILNNIDFELTQVKPRTLINTIEYRSVANEYLSYRKINNIDEIRLSPLKDVNDMLIADKIQNRKDFEIYHLGKHERSDELDAYFKNWMRKLNISEEMYLDFKNKLIIK